MRSRITSSLEAQGICQVLLLMVGLLAATGFAFVSIASNLRFGVSLGSRPFDQLIYGVLSVATDLMKIALPLVIAILWRNGERIFALAGAAFWIGAAAFSIFAAIGFAASSRGQTVAAAASRIENRNAWQAKIVRVEGRLDVLGTNRPVGVIQAEIDRLLRTPGADDCQVVNGPVTQQVCPQVDRLREELAASTEVARLETDLVADRKALSEIPEITPVADPQSATLSRLTGVSEESLRSAIAVLIAFLVELGSSLGFTVMVLCARLGGVAGRAPAVTTPSASTIEDRGTTSPFVRMPPDDLVMKWALTRLDIVSTGLIQADHAYQDFNAWCIAHRHAPITQQMFGRRFTKVHAGMGGRKIKRHGRAYYQGAALQNNPFAVARMSERAA